jgi:hypothetical protein
MPLENFPDPGPAGLWSAILAAFLAAWGGAVSYLHRIKRGKLRCSPREFAVEMFTSTFVGIIVFLLSVYLFGVPEWAAGGLSGLGGHAGTRTIFLLQTIFFKRAGGDK